MGNRLSPSSRQCEPAPEFSRQVRTVNQEPASSIPKRIVGSGRIPAKTKVRSRTGQCFRKNSRKKLLEREADFGEVIASNVPQARGDDADAPPLITSCSGASDRRLDLGLQFGVDA